MQRPVEDADVRQWTAVVDNGRARVSAYIRRVTPDRDAQRDLLAEAIARAWVCRRELIAAANPVTLLLDFARETCRVWARSRRREARLDPCDDVADDRDDEASSLSVEEAVCCTEWSSRILGRLSEKQRMAVDFRCRWDWPYNVIADVLGCSEATVRVHVWRGLRELRRVASADPPPLPLAPSVVTCESRL